MEKTSEVFQTSEVSWETYEGRRESLLQDNGQMPEGRRVGKRWCDAGVQREGRPRRVGGLRREGSNYHIKMPICK